MSNIFTAVRIFDFQTGGRIVVPISVWDNKVDAIKASGERGEAVRQIGEGRIVQMGPDGRVAVDSGMIVRQFLGSLGLAGIDHQVQESKFSSADILLVNQLPKLQRY